jgi:hypothetical protein
VATSGGAVESFALRGISVAELDERLHKTLTDLAFVALHLCAVADAVTPLDVEGSHLGALSAVLCLPRTLVEAPREGGSEERAAEGESLDPSEV